MDFSETYLYLFFDSFMVALLLPLQGHTALPVMKIFGGYNDWLMIVLPIISGIAASIINWGFGRITLTATKLDLKKMTKNSKVSFLTKYGYWILVLSFIPVLGSLLTVSFGFLGVSLRKIMTPVFISFVVFYIAYVF